MSEATQTEKKQAQKERKAYRAKKRKLFFKTLFSKLCWSAPSSFC